MKNTLKTLRAIGAIALATSLASIGYNHSQQAQANKTYWSQRQRTDLVRAIAPGQEEYAFLQKSIYDLENNSPSKSLVSRFSTNFNISQTEAEETISAFQRAYQDMKIVRSNGSPAAEANAYIEDESNRPNLKEIIAFEKAKGIDLNSNSGKFYSVAIDFIIKSGNHDSSQKNLGRLNVESPVIDLLKSKLLKERKSIRPYLEQNIREADVNHDGLVTTTELGNSCIKNSAKDQFINSVYYRF